MLFNHRNVDFDIDERLISQMLVIKIFDPILDICDRHDAAIVEVVVESDEYAMIMLEGDSPDEYSDAAIEIADEIPEMTDLDVSLSDEDYGELDVINIYIGDE